jgi:hypothetical protein
MDIKTLCLYLALREIDATQQAYGFVPNKEYIYRRIQDFCLREIRVTESEEIADTLKQVFWAINSQYDEK